MEINEAAFRDAGEAPAVVVFPWARASFDRVYKRRKRLFDYFRRLGACNIDFADYSDAIEEIARKVVCSNLIYLPGDAFRAILYGVGGLLTPILLFLYCFSVKSNLRTFSFCLLRFVAS